MTEADILSDRIAIIDHGKIVALDTPKGLKRMLKQSDDEILDIEIPNMTSNLVTELEAFDCVQKVLSRSSEEIRIIMNCDNPVAFITDFLSKHSLNIRADAPMKYALQIAFKDLKYFFRSRIAIFAFLIMPIFMMLMTGYIFPKMQSGANVKVAVYSLDSGFRKMMENKKTENFIFVDSEEELKQFLLDEKADVAMVIPEGFLSAMLKKQEIKVRLIPSPSNPQMAMAAAQGITASIGGSIGNMNDKFTLEMENPGGGEFNYYSFMAPGIMAMVAIMSVVNGLAAAITTEKERGTLDGILTTPIPRYSIVLGKTLAQGIRGILQAIIILLIAVFLFGATVQGSILLALFVLVLGIMSFIGVGIIITAGAPDQETSQMILTTLMFPMMFLSGVFFPVNQMPSFMQSISKFFPLTYAAEALRKVMVLGGTFQNISGDVIILLIFSVITFSLAVPLFGKLTTT